MEKIADLSSNGVRFAAVDLRETALEEALSEVGMSKDTATLFLLEGLTMYLPREVVISLLGSIQALAPVGSRVVLDYLLEDVLAGETGRYGAAGLLEKAEGHGEPLQCGFSPEGIETRVNSLGYKVRRHLQPAALSTRYLKGLNTDLTGPISDCFPNLVLAVEK
jgi:O-methyltransferase involved in polyketide biosynthesis